MTRRQLGLFQQPPTQVEAPDVEPWSAPDLGSRPTAVELFAGGGLFSLALAVEGVAAQHHCELDKTAVATLRLNLDDQAVVCDVRDYRPKRVEKGLDILAGGPPCQPWSVGGVRKGEDDPRNLWPEVVRLIGESRPRVFLMENVIGIMGKDFAGFRDWFWCAVEDLGYEGTIWRVEAAAYGTPQPRPRVWFVGWPKGAAWGAHLVRPPAPTHARPDQAASLGLLPWTRAFDRLNEGCCGGFGLSSCINLGNLDGACGSCFDGSNYEIAPNEVDTGEDLSPGARRYVEAMGIGKHPVIDVGGAMVRVSPEKRRRCGIFLAPTITKGRERWAEWHHLLATKAGQVISPSCPIEEAADALRLVTPREAAKLQDVPQWYAFEGTPRQQISQIGNGIAVNMGRAVIQHVLRAFGYQVPLAGSMSGKGGGEGLWPLDAPDICPVYGAAVRENPTLYEKFGAHAAPKPGEKGYKAPKVAAGAWGGANIGALASHMLDRATASMEDPDFFNAWHYEVEGGEEPELSLGDWLGVPYQGPKGEPLDEMNRALVGLYVADLALEVHPDKWRADELGGFGVSKSRKGPGHLITAQREGKGQLPVWAAKAMLEDALAPDPTLHLVSLSKQDAADFIEQHHSALPYLNARGLMYALGLKKGDRLVAVATAGTPTGQWKDPHNVIELSRVASDGSVKGAASKLVSRLLDVLDKSKRGDPDAPSLFVTYQLTTESGTTYKALKDKGLRPVAFLRGKSPSGARAGGAVADKALARADKIRWECCTTPPAGHAKWSLTDIDPTRQELMFNPSDQLSLFGIPVLYFASGSNHPGEIRGLVDVGLAPGVAAVECGPDCERELVAAGQAGLPVFIDSGAFSEFRGDPITPAQWEDRLALYKRVASAIGPLANVVAPDKVGDQEATLQRLQRYAPDLRELHDLGATILVPLQGGAMPIADFHQVVGEVLGFTNWMPAIPMKAAATSPAQLGDYLAAMHPHRVHLLGLGPSNPKAKAVARAVMENAPHTEVQLDSVLIKGFVGREERIRPLTAAQDFERVEMITHRWSGYPKEYRSREGYQLPDYTDVIGDPSGWLTPTARKRIDKELGLTGKERTLWRKDPTDYLAEYEMDPYLDTLLEDEWNKHAEKLEVSEVKRRGMGIFGEQHAPPREIRPNPRAEGHTPGADTPAPPGMAMGLYAGASYAQVDDAGPGRVVILNMGLGRDSLTMLCLLAKGELVWEGKKHGPEDVDAVVFSDTGTEWKHTYKLIPRVRAFSKKHGIRFFVLAKPRPGTETSQLMDDWLVAMAAGRAEKEEGWDEVYQEVVAPKYREKDRQLDKMRAKKAEEIKKLRNKLKAEGLSADERKAPIQAVRDKYAASMAKYKSKVEKEVADFKKAGGWQFEAERAWWAPHGKERRTKYDSIEKRAAAGVYHLRPELLTDFAWKGTIPLRSDKSCTGNHKVAPIRKVTEDLAIEKFGPWANNTKWGSEVAKAGMINIGTTKKPNYVWDDWVTPEHLRNVLAGKAGGRMPHLNLIGLAADETDRLAKGGDVGCFSARYVDEAYPLAEMGIGKPDEQAYLDACGFGDVRKSGCWMCPYQPIGWWWALSVLEPELFQRAVEAEIESTRRDPKLHFTGAKEKKRGLLLPESIARWRERNPDADPTSVLEKQYSKCAITFAKKNPKRDACCANDCERFVELWLQFGIPEWLERTQPERTNPGTNGVGDGGTAIQRKGPSAPVRYLEEHDLIRSPVLDFGSGYGEDAAWLREQGYQVREYDPNFEGVHKLPKGTYNTVLCTYVVNVLPQADEAKLLKQVRARLRKNGLGFVTVRSDVAKAGKTSRGYQRPVQLQADTVTGAPSSSRIYILDKRKPNPSAQVGMFGEYRPPAMVGDDNLPDPMQEYAELWEDVARAEGIDPRNPKVNVNKFSQASKDRLAEWMPDLRWYDLILVNTSAGKDSLVMLEVINQLTEPGGPYEDVRNRVISIHADLGEAEHPGVCKLAEEHARITGIPLTVIKPRIYGELTGLLEEVEKRAQSIQRANERRRAAGEPPKKVSAAPGFGTRYCTKALKTAPVGKWLTGWKQANFGDGDIRDKYGRRIRILNLLGLRAQESDLRAKQGFRVKEDYTDKTRAITHEWLPIQFRTEEEVWDVIRERNLPYHEAYDVGFGRLSCGICPLAGDDDLMLGMLVYPELAEKMIALERKYDFKWKETKSATDLLEQAEQRPDLVAQADAARQRLRRNPAQDADFHRRLWSALAHGDPPPTHVYGEVGVAPPGYGGAMKVNPENPENPDNPDFGSEAAERYTSSHWGLEPAAAYEFEDKHLPAELTEMGKLAELGVEIEKDGELWLYPIKFAPRDTNIVAFSPDEAERLYLVLDKQTRKRTRRDMRASRVGYKSLRGVAEKIGGRQAEYPYPSVRVQPIGPLVHVVYSTNKQGDGPSQYIHTFGKDEDGETELPWLCIDKEGRLWLAGGGYTVPDAGITD